MFTSEHAHSCPQSQKWSVVYIHCTLWNVYWIDWSTPVKSTRVLTSGKDTTPLWPEPVVSASAPVIWYISPNGTNEQEKAPAYSHLARSSYLRKRIISTCMIHLDHFSLCVFLTFGFYSQYHASEYIHIVLDSLVLSGLPQLLLNRWPRSSWRGSSLSQIPLNLSSYFLDYSRLRTVLGFVLLIVCQPHVVVHAIVAVCYCPHTIMQSTKKISEVCWAHETC